MRIADEMNVDRNYFWHAIFENEDSISRTVTAALEELGERAPTFELSLAHGFLGQGRWGVAFRTSSPRWVAKISADPDEGPVVASIIEDSELRDHPGICYYAGIWRFRPAQRRGLERLFLILREALLPMDEYWRGNDQTDTEEKADDLLDDVIIASHFLNEAILDKADEEELILYAEDWGALVGRLGSLRPTKALAEYMLLFFSRTGGVLADIHSANCGLRTRPLSFTGIPRSMKQTHRRSKQWVAFDPGVSVAHGRPRIPLIKNPGLPHTVPFLLS